MFTDLDSLLAIVAHERDNGQAKLSSGVLFPRRLLKALIVENEAVTEVKLPYTIVLDGT